ncbi:Alpha/beta fold hydrolase [Hyphomicrobiales bacterium]|nr:Alpha/beta fold hydrolase [Hyphomicrobiales bacterium]CAH1692336.1 Alpha/beta fold hydrolase [Hyphomicrobiales bacterium]
MSGDLVEGRGQRNLREKTIEINDLVVHYRKTGAGLPVVFLHGLAEDGSSWDEVVAGVGDGVAAYAVDFRGHGGTTFGDGNGTVGQLADDLNAFLEKVTGSAVCVGFSLGGVITLEAALRRPDLARMVVVVGSSSKVGRAAAGFFAERIELLTRDPEAFRIALATDTAAQIVRRKESLDSVNAKRLRAVGEGAGYVNAARAMLELALAPMTERLREIKVPVHIIQARDDVFCPVKAAGILREAIPAAGYSEIPCAGHLITVDQPDLLAAEIRRILKI